jgi:hypothetical protein
MLKIQTAIITNATYLGALLSPVINAATIVIINTSIMVDLSNNLNQNIQ